MGRTLVITNDFPPRQGGIESFVLALTERLAPSDVVVHTARMPGDRAFDRGLGYPVYRDRSSTLLPTPRVRDRAVSILQSEGCSSVLFGASAPLGLLAAPLRAAGATRVVGLTHGHECWWARLPGTRALLHSIGDATDALTFLGEYTRTAIGPALSPAARSRMVRLPPGVDVQRFRPGSGGATVRSRLGIGPHERVVACIARLTARKGQDMLVRAWAQVRRAVPDAHLLLVGAGPHETAVRRLVERSGEGASIHLVGPVAWADLPPWFDAADVFAMPCRTRRLGLEPEALGIVFLEASASGLPVVVGRSGGAPDACLPGRTGLVVDPRSTTEVADAVVRLLLDPLRAREMGERGREWVRREWAWDAVVERLHGLLDGDGGDEAVREPGTG